MTFGIYTVKDELANSFLGLSLFASEAEATRQFKDHINGIDLWRNNASDFSLYRNGFLDNETGEITPDNTKIVSGHSVLERGEHGEA